MYSVLETPRAAKLQPTCFQQRNCPREWSVKVLEVQSQLVLRIMLRGISRTLFAESGRSEKSEVHFVFFILGTTDQDAQRFVWGILVLGSVLEDNPFQFAPAWNHEPQCFKQVFGRILVPRIFQALEPTWNFLRIVTHILVHFQYQILQRYSKMILVIISAVPYRFELPRLRNQESANKWGILVLGARIEKFRIL